MRVSGNLGWRCSSRPCLPVGPVISTVKRSAGNQPVSSPPRAEAGVDGVAKFDQLEAALPHGADLGEAGHARYGNPAPVDLGEAPLLDLAALLEIEFDGAGDVGRAGPAGEPGARGQLDGDHRQDAALQLAGESAEVPREATLNLGHELVRQGVQADGGGGIQ